LSQSIKLKVKGLKTQTNPLSGSPVGGMKVAQNIIISRDDTGETRPGFEHLDPAFSSGGTYYRAIAGTFYDDKQVAMSLATSSLYVPLTEPTQYSLLLNRLSSGSWDALLATDFQHTSSSKFVDPVDEDVARTRFCQANGNLYLTTLYGVKKLVGPTFKDEAGNRNIRRAGVNKALDTRNAYLKSSNTPAYNTGFLSEDSAVAYRSAWGITDDNGNLVLGQPSGRVVVRNYVETVALTKVGTTVTATRSGGGEFFGFRSADGSPGFTVGDQFEITDSTDLVAFPVGIATITGSTGSTAVTYTGNATAGTATALVHWGTRPVNLVIDTPAWVTSQYRLYVYRSNDAADAESEPGDDMRQVYEATGLSASSTHAVTDITPESLRQAFLYTSPSQDGPFQGNEIPPQASDIALFNGHMFYGGATGKHSFVFSFLVNPSNNDTIRFNHLLYTAKTSPGSAGEYQIDTNASLSTTEQIESTAKNFIDAVNNDTRVNEKFIQASYLSSAEGISGTVLIECLAMGPQYDESGVYLFYSEGFSVSGDASSAGKHSPALPTALTGVTITGNFAKDNGVTTVTATAHGLVVGDLITLYSSSVGGSAIPQGMKRVASVVSANAFTYNENTSESGSLAYATWTCAKVALPSTAPGGPSSVFVSKFQQPEAVPIVNEIRVGSANKAIIRLVPLVDALYVLKEDGIFRITGDNTNNFRVDEFDGTVVILAPESVAKVENQVVFLSNKGVVSVSASGVVVLSRDVDPDLTRLYQQNATVCRNKATAVGYETKRLYLLSLPEYEETENTVTYCYNFVTRAWSTWTAAKTFWMVDPVADLLYGGNATERKLSLERRNLTLEDYKDEAGEAIDVRMRWNVETGGNPDMLKHFREIAVFFRDSGFSELDIAFSSEISSEEEVFTVIGTTDNTYWGEGLWGDGLWGGGGPSGRTYRFWLPKNKARCSQLTVELRHAVAEEFIATTGMSITYTGGTEGKATLGAGVK
jgi:hypothetical protein